MPYECEGGPPVPAHAAAEGGIVYSTHVDTRAPRRRTPTVRGVAESRDSGKHRRPDSPVAGVARDDAEPASGKIASVAVVSLAYRKRADDAEPGNVGENLRSPGRGTEPLLHSGIERRSPAGGPVHSGIAAFPATARLGAMARHIEEAASH